MKHLALFAFLLLATPAHATTVPPQPIVRTYDVSLMLDGLHANPQIAVMQGNHLDVSNRAEESLPASVEASGISVPLTWQHKPELDEHHYPDLAVLVYESAQPRLRLRWAWRAPASHGPIEHTITVENLGNQEIWLPLIDSLRLDIRVHPGDDPRAFYVEKGADKPSPQGTHLDTIADSYNWTGTSSTYAHPGPGEPREIIPAVLVFNNAQPQQGWYAGIEFSGRTRISVERHANRITAVLGLNPVPGPFRTRLTPGGSFETPTVFFGAFSGGPDGAANQLRPWIRAALGNPLTWKDPHYPYVVNNSWGSGMAVDEPLALRMITESKELGVEMFHIDAGWFRGVGDWYPDPNKFPRGLAPIADEAHRQGLRFGIWVDWTQAGISPEHDALNVRDPKVADWIVSDLPPNWKPEEFKGETVDLGVPAAHDHLLKEVNRLIDDNHLDMLEQDGYLVAQGCIRRDHPHAPPNQSTIRITHDSGFDFVDADNSTDVSYHATRAYYDIYARTRARHPGLLFEICNDGGRMIDFGSAAHGDYFSMTDSYDPLSNRRAFYDTSYMLPTAMLESYVEKWPTPWPENFLYMLRSGMMGWLTLMLDTSAWTPEQHQSAKDAIALYKEKLRPLIRDAQLFHISPRPDGMHWDALEYWNPARKQGVVYAFRGSAPGEPQHAFPLAGLDPAQTYTLHFQDGTSPDRPATGRELLQGLTLTLAQPLSSELVFLTGAPPPR
ncbi:MAG TPA: alpha-galactosidase [Terracidiphilus sp.]